MRNLFGLRLVHLVYFGAMVGADQLIAGHIRSPLIVQCLILFIHLFGTLQLAFQEFDIETERFHAFYYSESGRYAFFAFLASIVSNALVDPHAPEGLTPSLVIGTLLAFCCLTVIWTSRTMTRGKNHSLFLESHPLDEILTFICALKGVKYHERAEAIELTLLRGALPSPEFVGESSKQLKQNGVSDHIIDNMITALAFLEKQHSSSN